PLTAENFADAVFRVARFRGRPVVVKLGGSAMEDPAATEACLRSVAVLHQLGLHLVLVHGGGKPIDRAMAEAGLTPKQVAGRRYTDDATLGIVVRVLQDLNVGLATRLAELGGPALPLPNSPLFGERLLLAGTDSRPVDLGRVGKVNRVNTNTLN